MNKCRGGCRNKMNTGESISVHTFTARYDMWLEHIRYVCPTCQTSFILDKNRFKQVLKGHNNSWTLVGRRKTY